MRSIWKGHIRFSLVTIPIQVFNAINTSSAVRFNQLHKEDMGRVSYRKVCRTCSEELSMKDIVKGYEYADDQYVVLEPQEFDAIKLKSTRAIDIESFVDIKEVHPSRFEAVYYVGPNGDVAKQTYQLFCQVLKNSKKAGVGRIILRDKEDVVLLTSEGNGLIMYKLRYPDEVRNLEDVPGLDQTDVDQKQLELAQTLVDSLATPFSEIDFTDRYKSALMELVNEKIAGKEIVSITDEKEEAPAIDIMDALKASIERTKKVKKGA